MKIIPSNYGSAGPFATRKFGMTCNSLAVAEHAKSLLENLRDQHIAALGVAPDGYEIAYVENWPVTITVCSVGSDGKYKVNMRGCPVFVRADFIPADRDEWKPKPGESIEQTIARNDAEQKRINAAVYPKIHVLEVGESECYKDVELSSWWNGRNDTASAIVWIAGQYVSGDTPSTVWNFQGVFDSEEKAISATNDNPSIWIAPAVMNQELPIETVDWHGSYYPYERKRGIREWVYPPKAVTEATEAIA